MKALKDRFFLLYSSFISFSLIGFNIFCFFLEMKLIEFFLTILLFNYLESKPTAGQLTVSDRCQDPTNEQLEELLSREFKNILNKIEEGIDIYPPVQKKYNISMSSISSSNYNDISNENVIDKNRKHGNTRCSRSEQTIWQANEISICPYHFVEIKRKNRFPFSLKQASCNCKECIGLKKSKCLPVNIAKPALEKDYCSLDTGLFKWTFIMEYVAVGCSCKQMLELD